MLLTSAQLIYPNAIGLRDNFWRLGIILISLIILDGISIESVPLENGGRDTDYNNVPLLLQRSVVWEILI